MIATFIGHLEHPPTMTRREPFMIRVSTTGATDPASLWRVERGDCPACRKGHDGLRAAWRRPTASERPGGVLDIADFASPVAGEDEHYGHPRTVRVAL